MKNEKVQTKLEKPQDKKKKFIAADIPVDEVGAGDLIVTKEQRGRVFGTYKLRSEDFGICEGQWRTHVHIRGGCYDTRFSTVRVAFEDDRPEAEELAANLGISVEAAQEIMDFNDMTPEEQLLIKIFGKMNA